MKLKMILSIITFLILVQSVEAIPSSIGVSPEKIELELAPGSSETQTLCITNNGITTETYELSIDNPKYIDSPCNLVTIGPKKSENVEVVIKLPPSIKEKEVKSKISIKATTGNVLGGVKIPVKIKVSSPGSSGGGSSGSSSGGGGGGGSPEPASNVKCKELSQKSVIGGNHVKFIFSRNTTSVVYLEFDAKKSFGKVTSIVEMLKEKSILTPETPDGEVYNYLNIWVGNKGMATPKNIENAVVCFRVSKAWINENEIDVNSITLNHYVDKKWNQLPTKKTNEDDEYIYFEAETPSFSPFSITGQIRESENLNITPILDNSSNGTTGEEAQAPGNESNEEKPGFLPGFDIFLAGAGLVISGLLIKRRIIN